MDKLKRLRYERGLSVTELATKSGVGRTSITLMEAGKRKARGATVGKLALALDVSLDDLAEYIDESAAERGRLGGRPRKEDQAAPQDVPESALVAA